MSFSDPLVHVAVLLLAYATSALAIPVERKVPKVGFEMWLAAFLGSFMYLMYHSLTGWWYVAAAGAVIIGWMTPLLLMELWYLGTTTVQALTKATAVHRQHQQARRARCPPKAVDVMQQNKLPHEENLGD